MTNAHSGKYDKAMTIAAAPIDEYVTQQYLDIFRNAERSVMIRVGDERTARSARLAMVRVIASFKGVGTCAELAAPDRPSDAHERALSRITGTRRSELLREILPAGDEDIGGAADPGAYELQLLDKSAKACQARRAATDFRWTLLTPAMADTIVKG